MGMSLWYAANLKFDGTVLTTIDTDEVVIDFSGRLWVGASREEIEKTVLKKVKKALDSQGF